MIAERTQEPGTQKDQQYQHLTKAIRERRGTLSFLAPLVTFWLWFQTLVSTLPDNMQHGGRDAAAMLGVQARSLSAMLRGVCQAELLPFALGWRQRLVCGATTLWP